MLPVGAIFEAEGSRWVVLQPHQYEVRYDMFSTFGEVEYSYLAMRLSKTGKPLKSIWRFSSESGAAHKVSRQVRQIGKAKVEYAVSDIHLTDYSK